MGREGKENVGGGEWRSKKGGKGSNFKKCFSYSTINLKNQIGSEDDKKGEENVH
jgi:hypothetical protein